MQTVKHYTSFEALKSDSCTSKQEHDQASLYESSLHDFVTLLKENVVAPRPKDIIDIAMLKSIRDTREDQSR